MENVGTLSAKVTADIRGLTVNLSRATQQIRTFRDKTSRILKANAESFRRLGRAAGVLGTTISASMMLVVKTAGDLEKGYIEVAKRTGFADEEMVKFQKSLERLAISMAGVSIKELQSIAATAGQLGIQGVNNILIFTRTIAKMGVATNLSADEAAIGMARLLKVLGLGVDKAEKLGSAMNELSNNTTATSSDILDITKRMGAVAKQFGLTAAETLGFSATIRDIGGRLESGGSAIMKIFNQMMSEAELFASVSGVSLKEYKKLVDENPIKALKNFLIHLQSLGKWQKNEVIEKMGLAGMRVKPIIAALADSEELLAKNMGMATKAYEEGTSLQREYETASKALFAQLMRLKDSIVILAAKIGDTLLPEIKSLIDKTIPIITQLKQWNEKYKDLTAAITKFTAALGLSLLGATALGYALFGIGTTMAALSKVVRALGSIFAAMWAKVLAPALPLIALFATLGAAVYAFRAAWKQNLQAIRDRFEDFVNMIRVGYNKIKKVTSEVLNWFGINWLKVLKGVYKRFKEFISDIVAGVKSAWAWLKGEDWAAAYVKAFENTMKGLGDFEDKVKITLDEIKIDLGAFGEATTEHWKDLWEAIKKQAGEDMDALIKIIKEKMPALYDLFAGVGIPEFKLPAGLGAAPAAKKKPATAAQIVDTKAITDAANYVLRETDRIANDEYLTRLERKQALLNLEKEYAYLFTEENKKSFEEVENAYQSLTEEIVHLDKMRLDQFKIYMMELRESFQDWALFVSEKMADVARKIEESLSTAFEGIMHDARNWRDVVTNLIGDVRRAFERLVAQMLARKMMGLLTAGGTGGLLGGLGGLFKPMALGGIVNQPTPILAGESGPEAIIPLNKKGALPEKSQPVRVTVNVNAIDGENAYQFLSKNKAAIASLMQSTMTNNHPLRRNF